MKEDIVKIKIKFRHKVTLRKEVESIYCRIFICEKNGSNV